jgi:hypothetical protein
MELNYRVCLHTFIVIIGDTNTSKRQRQFKFWFDRVSLHKFKRIKK